MVEVEDGDAKKKKSRGERTTVTGEATGTTFSSFESASFVFSHITFTSSSEMISPRNSCSICAIGNTDGKPRVVNLGWSKGESFLSQKS